MQDRPEAPDLLDAVAEYLFAELRPEVPRDQRFKVLVAANLCAVVARELRAGPDPSLEDVALFREILGARGPQPVPQEAEAEAREAARELALLIRDGSLDEDLDTAIERLREHVRRKLEIARPDYADD